MLLLPSSHLLVCLLHGNGAPGRIFNEFQHFPDSRALKNMSLRMLTRVGHVHGSMKPFAEKRWNLACDRNKNLTYVPEILDVAMQGSNPETIRWVLSMLPKDGSVPMNLVDLALNKRLDQHEIVSILKEFHYLIPEIEDKDAYNAYAILSGMMYDDKLEIVRFLVEERGYLVPLTYLEFEYCRPSADASQEKLREYLAENEHVTIDDEDKYDLGCSTDGFPMGLNPYADDPEGDQENDYEYCLRYIEQAKTSSREECMYVPGGSFEATKLMYESPHLVKDYHGTFWNAAPCETGCGWSSVLADQMADENCVDWDGHDEFASSDHGFEGTTSLVNFIQWIPLHQTEERLKSLDYMLSKPEYNLDMIGIDDPNSTSFNSICYEFDRQLPSPVFNHFEVFKIFMTRAPKFTLQLMQEQAGYEPRILPEHLKHLQMVEQLMKDANVPSNDFRKWITSVFHCVCQAGNDVDMIEYLLTNHLGMCDLKQVPIFADNVLEFLAKKGWL